VSVCLSGQFPGTARTFVFLFFFYGFCFLGRLSRWGKNSAVASSSLLRLFLLLQSTRGCCCRWLLARFGSWGNPVISMTLPEADTQSSQGLRDQRKRGIAWDSLCVQIHRQHSYLLQVRPKQRWIWLKSIRLLKHLLFLLFLLHHHHHLAGLCPRKKIQRLKRLCRSSAIRVVIMEKLWYLRFCMCLMQAWNVGLSTSFMLLWLSRNIVVGSLLTWIYDYKYLSQIISLIPSFNEWYFISILKSTTMGWSLLLHILVKT